MSVLIVTSVGDIVVDLHTDRCPLTSKNFLKLCKMKYYNGCLFNKVEKDFIAKTGDRTGTGTGGESVYKLLYGDQARFFADEIHPDLKHSKIGTVAMASAGENCNASQFYFTLRDELDYLDGKHTVFGIVEEKEGLDTLAKINESYVDGEGRPFKDIRIKHTYILDDPFEDPPQLAELIPENSPEGKPQDETAEERLEDNWVPMDETLGAEELEERIHMKAAHTNAAILESVGDIPDAEIKPPENVLFVCKLNPVTQDEDLFTIFSRFGNVTSADIIRDYKTGDSLCYAFIEFEDKEACERAYFKMDNTLIDDRRIHVDFSQSVAKLWGQYRHGKGNPSSKGGCFKCGAPDHIARDCGQASGNNQKGPKYVLKNDDTQRGGDNRKRYEMLFDENEGSGDHEGDRRTNKQKEGHQKIDDPAHRDNFKGSERRHYDSDRSRHSRGDERKHDSRRHDRHHEDKETEERKHDRRHDRCHSDNETDERLDREHRRRLESSRHRGDDGDHRRSGSNRNGKEDYRNRSPESDRHRRDDGYYERKSRDRDDETYRERRHRDDRWK